MAVHQSTTAQYLKLEKYRYAIHIKEYTPIKKEFWKISMEGYTAYLYKCLEGTC